MIQDTRISHLAWTYFESTFDMYIDSYLPKEINNLNLIYDENFEELIQTMKVSNVAKMNEMGSLADKGIRSKFTFKAILEPKI